MSNDAGDSSSRLSDALDEVFSSRRQSQDEPPANGEPDESYELPEIVPATDEPDLPRLPRPEPVTPASPPPEPVVSTPAPTPPAAAAPRQAVGQAAAGTPAVPATAPATGWGDHMPVTTTPAASQLRTPGRRPRVRRVTRVLRHIDPWSTFKIALLFSAVAYVVGLTSGVLLWRVADSTGTLDNVERWFTQFGWETFELKGGEIFHNAWIIGLFGVVAATGAAVLLVTLFNLVSDIVGGIRMTVLEEEVVERTISSTRRYVVRTPSPDVTSPTGVPAPAWSVDDDASTDDASTDDQSDDAAGATQHTTVAPDGAGIEPTREQPATSWSVD